MGRQGANIIFAVLLIGLGVLFLLSNFNMLPFEIEDNNIFWTVAFAVGGLAFIAAYISNARENWWAVIPGFTLLGLAALVALPESVQEMGGGLFLGMIGLSFWVIYFTRREFWWAIIPGGVLLTLAVVAGFSNLMEGTTTGAFFFLGLAATFFVVYFMPTQEGRMLWAIWPAGVLGILGMLLLAGAEGMARFVWPLFLLVAGGLLVFRALRPGAR